MKKHKARVLIIAGSDSSGGAGIQGDIKTVSAFGGYAATAITSITVQNTLGVSAVFDIPPDILRGQIRAVLNDIGADVIKTGMLSSSEIINIVAEEFENYLKINSLVKLVVDPVMIAKGGASLLRADAVNCLKEKLIPLAYLITPNIPEAEILSNLEIKSEDDMVLAARKIINQLKPMNVLLKGGHLEGGKVVDILFGQHILRGESDKINTKNTHGTGCAMASAISTLLARGIQIEDAFQEARKYIHNAIKNSPDIGHGHGPIDHFWKFDFQ